MNNNKLNPKQLGLKHNKKCLKYPNCDICMVFEIEYDEGKLKQCVKVKNKKYCECVYARK